MTVIETITKIEEYGGESPDFGTEAGFKIHTTSQIIDLMIDNDASCCEDWGYFLTEDDREKFVGATLIGVKITDTNRSTKTFNDPKAKWDDAGNIALDAGEVMFVDIETSEGNLQFVAYNSHNGYYGHEAVVRSTQLTHSAIL